MACKNPSMLHVLLDRMIETDYGQLDLLWADDYVGFDGNVDRFFAGQVNGLVGAASGAGLYLNLARRSGGSSVRIVRLDEAPDIDDDKWEDIVEASTTIPAGAHPRWATWAGEDGGSLDLGQGTYRVRVSARGRDVGQFADGTMDCYLVEIWPAPTREDSIIKLSSANAEYWHREVGSRR